MPRFARFGLLFGATALLLALFVFTSPGCDKGPARECDQNFECGPGLVCDFGSNQCVAPNQSACAEAGVACTGDTPYCYPEAATCVACLDQGGHRECKDNWICEQRNCMACERDDACIGNSAQENTICLNTAGCAEQDDVAYVSAGTDGTDNDACTFATPCSSLAKAIATNKKYLRLRGDFTLTAPLAIARDVQIYGERGGLTSITRTGAGAIFEVSGTGTVGLNNLALEGASGSGGHAIAVTGGSPKLALYRVDLLDNEGLGISGGTSGLTVDGSLFVNNAGGGIATNGTVFIENSYFVNNGAATSNGGAIDLSSTSADNVIRYSTFANNTGTIRAVRCGDAAVKISSNIFSGPSPQVGTCTTASSLFSVMPAAPGATNLVGDPRFGPTALTTRDRDLMDYYRILAGSPARDKGEDLATSVQDFYGDRREAPRDIGADEFAE